MSRNSLHTNIENSNIALLLEVEKALAEGNNAQASSSNAGILPANTLEESYQMYYEALRHFEENSFSETDSLILMNLVYGCPTLQGPSVSQAATLFNSVYEMAEVFENICPEYLDKSLLQPTADKHGGGKQFMIYPIPNDGVFYLRGKINANSTVEITNSIGSIVLKIAIVEETNNRLLKTNLNSGTYMLRIKDKDGSVIFKEKIVVIQ